MRKNEVIKIFYYNYDKKILELILTVLQQNELILIKNSIIYLTEKGKIFTENHPKSLKYSCILWAEEHLTTWQNLDYTLHSGKPAFKHIFGISHFDFLANNPEKLRIYHKAMTEYARDDYKDICKLIDFSKFNTVLDIGGSLGELLKIIKKYHKSKKLILFDKPEVVKADR